MIFRKITEADCAELFPLQRAYKKAIEENQPTDTELQRLAEAIRTRRILFFGCEIEGRLVAMCSVCWTFSTFDYELGGVFEDFFIKPEFRHKGIAKRLVKYAYVESGVSSLSVACADCDVEKYNALGFSIPLGNMLAFEAEWE